MRSLLAEPRKVRRPAIWVILSIVVIMAALGAVEAQLRADNTDMMKSPSAYLASAIGSLADSPQPTCSELNLPEGTACNRAKAKMSARQNVGQQFAVAALRKEVTSSVRQVAFANRMTTPGGSLSEVLEAMASLPGFVLAVCLSAVFVAGEWSGRTDRQLFVTEPRRWVVYAEKFVTIYVLLLVATVCAWLTVWIVGAAMNHGASASKELLGLVAQTDLGSEAGVCAKGLGVLFFYTAVTMVLASVARGGGQAIAASVVVLLAFGVLAASSRLSVWSPVDWLSTVVRFRPNSPLVIWRNPPGHQSVWAAISELVAVTIACLAAGVALFHKPVRS